MVDSIAPRVSSLETAVAALTLDVRTIAQSINTLRDMISAQQRPQWGNLIAAVAVGVVIVGSIGASFIAPLTIAIQNHDRLFSDRGHMISELRDKTDALQVRTTTNEKVFEAQMNDLVKAFLDVKINGSTITRERLAVIENRLFGTVPEGPGPLKLP